MAAASPSTSCEVKEPLRRRRTKDGRSFVFDPCSNAWRLEDAGVVTTNVETLALPWSQFNVSFNGAFRIGEIAILLGDDPERRPIDSQEHADTGSSVWDGAVALAKVLERQPFLVQNRKVLEVGAGRGLVGLAAWALGASMWVTDLAYTLEAMHQAWHSTSSAAGSQVVEDLPKLEMAELDWSRASEFFEQRPDLEVEVILAADVVWLMELVEPLADALSTAAQFCPKVEILVVHQTRSANVEMAFLQAMAARKLQPVWTLPGGSKEGVEVSQQRIQWHEDFVPDQRIKLWCFQAERAIGKEKDQRNQGLVSRQESFFMGPNDRPLDWPLSQHEKRDCVIRLYDQDVRATDEELEALQAELDSVRRASSMSTAIEAPAAAEPAVAAVAPEMSPMAWRGPPGLVAPASVGDAEQIAQLRAEIATASATLYRATAALRALEEKMHDTGSDESHASIQNGPFSSAVPGGLSRSRSEGPNGPGILSSHRSNVGTRGRSLDHFKRRVSFDGTSVPPEEIEDVTAEHHAEPEPEMSISDRREDIHSSGRRHRRSVPSQPSQRAPKAGPRANGLTPRRGKQQTPQEPDRRDGSGVEPGTNGVPGRRVWMGRRISR
eukprot:symbB.v1.2.033830.t1/scaffold4258.1/size42288/2